MASGEIEILDPRAVGAERKGMSPRVTSLEGKVIGVRHLTLWRKFDVFLRRLEELLLEKYRVKGLVWLNVDADKNSSADLAGIVSLAAKVDVAISGLAG